MGSPLVCTHTCVSVLFFGKTTLLSRSRNTFRQRSGIHRRPERKQRFSIFLATLTPLSPLSRYQHIYFRASVVSGTERLLPVLIVSRVCTVGNRSSRASSRLWSWTLERRASASASALARSRRGRGERPVARGRRTCRWKSTRRPPRQVRAELLLLRSTLCERTSCVGYIVTKFDSEVRSKDQPLKRKRNGRLAVLLALPEVRHCRCCGMIFSVFSAGSAYVTAWGVHMYQSPQCARIRFRRPSGPTSRTLSYRVDLCNKCP